MTDARKILVVDDEPQIRRFLRTGLGVQGYEVLEATSGEQAIEMLPAAAPDAIVLDLELGGIDGFEVLRRLREWSWTPTIVLSVRNRESDKVRALELGADDYLSKPFGMAELAARIAAILRRLPEIAGQPAVAIGDLSVDMARRQVFRAGAEIKLSRKEYQLLQFLARHCGKVVTHQQLLAEVWGQGHSNDVHYLRIFMRKLRHKIEVDATQPRFIQTELGVGYRLLAPDQYESQA